jgi:hypothetical protein
VKNFRVVVHAIRGISDSVNTEVYKREPKSQSWLLIDKHRDRPEDVLDWIDNLSKQDVIVEFSPEAQELLGKKRS